MMIELNGAVLNVEWIVTDWLYDSTNKNSLVSTKEINKQNSLVSSSFSLRRE